MYLSIPVHEHAAPWLCPWFCLRPGDAQWRVCNAGTRLPFVQYIASLAVLQAIQAEAGRCLRTGRP